MNQLTVGDLLKLFYRIQVENKISLEEIKKMPIYLGNDDELNGIHTGWYANFIDRKDEKNEDNQYYVDLINEDCNNVELKDQYAILIS